MKIVITFKCPDAVPCALFGVSEINKETVEESISKWIKYGEYIKVEFDTDAGTATVLRP